MSEQALTPKCGACRKPATKRLRSGLLRCQECYDALGFCRLPKGIDNLVIREHRPASVQRDQPTVRRDPTDLSRLVNDWKRKQSGEGAA